ncbi:hypothetical protein AV540_06620 [Brevibacillus parabrevis]|uniref:hypothetical protein n=1 Tax=Brevibacillus parabrevis TaxID=54914 RepID=UPI0007AB99BE|nr:hypothetical protein [Brevibacillus parabrevis]KZE54700.1 hypothetical protein AV540_06620 [Brevibacillus parabrevis]
MRRSKDKLTVIYQKGKKRMVVRTSLQDSRRVVVVLNTQFTNAPNTTQISRKWGAAIRRKQPLRTSKGRRRKSS